MKCISVPMSYEAMQRLDLDENIEGDLIDVILTSSEFDSLCKSGLFRKINDRFGLNIDDYEDESLTGSDNLLVLKEMLRDYFLLDESNVALNKLMSQVDNAMISNTGIFFYF